MNNKNFLDMNPKLTLTGKITLTPNIEKQGKLLEKIPVKIVKKQSYGYYQIKICSDYIKDKLSLKSG